MRSAVCSSGRDVAGSLRILPQAPGAASQKVGGVSHINRWRGADWILLLLPRSRKTYIRLTIKQITPSALAERPVIFRTASFDIAATCKAGAIRSFFCAYSSWIACERSRLS